MFIDDRENQRIRNVESLGTFTTVAGNGNAGFSGDGGPAELASLFEPTCVAFSETGELYIADSGNSRVRKVVFTSRPVLTLTGLTATNAGEYRVIISSPYGSVTSAVATVTLALPQLYAASRISGGMLLTASSDPGTSYVLQASANLVSPISWIPMSTNRTGSSGVWSYVDTQAPSAPHRFYRLALP
jgi:hypothetical protein